MRKKRKYLSPVAFFLTFLLMFQTFTPVAFAEGIVGQEPQYEAEQGDGIHDSAGNIEQGVGEEPNEAGEAVVTENNDDGTEPSEENGAVDTENNGDGTEPTEADGTNDTENNGDGAEPTEADGTNDTENNGDGAEPNEADGTNDTENNGDGTKPTEADGTNDTENNGDGAEPSEGQAKTEEDFIGPTLDVPLDTLFLLQEVNQEQPEDVTSLIMEKGNLIAKVFQDGTEVTGNKLEHGKDIEIEYFFDVPIKGDAVATEGYVSNRDYAEFDLPESLILSGENTEKDLFTEGNVKIGKVIFDTEAHKAKITFDNEDVFNNPDMIEVSAQFSALMKYGGTNESEEEKDIVIKILEKEFTITVPGKEVITVSGQKYGTIDFNNKVVTWTVKITPTSSKGGDTDNFSLEGYIFTDDLSNVGVYKEGTFHIGGDPATPTYSNNLLSYEFTDSHQGEQGLTFQTELPDDLSDYYDASTKTYSIPNSASVENESTEDSDTFDGNAEATISWIKKVGVPYHQGESPEEGTYDPANRKIRWTIILNENYMPIENAIVKDDLMEGLKFDTTKGDFATIEYFEPGETIGEWQDTAEKIDNSGSETKLEFELGNKLSGKKARLTVITSVIDTKPTTGTTNYKNTAELYGDNDEETSKGTGTSGNVGIGFNPISKTGLENEYDRANHIAKWSVTVNPKGQNYGGDLRVLDLIVYGEDKISYADVSSQLTGVITDEAEFAGLQQAFNQKYSANSFESNGLIIKPITLKIGTEAVADLLVVTGFDKDKSSTFTYKTIVMDPNIYATNSGGTISNTATLFAGDKKISDAPASQNIPSKMLSKNMLTRESAAAFESDWDVSGIVRTSDITKGYRYDDKSVIFSILVNENGLNNANEALGNITVTDTLPKGWEFKLLNGLNYLIYEASGDPLKPTSVPSDLQNVLTANFGMSDNKAKAEFTFKSLTKPYIIFVKAGPAEETINEYFSENKIYSGSDLTNYVVMKGENDFKAGKNPIDSQEVQINNKFLEKSAKVLADASEVEWTVEYKPYDLEHVGKFIEDKLPLGLDLRLTANGELNFDNENITMTPLTMKADGSYENGSPFTPEELKKYVSYDNAKRILKFTFKTVDQAYRFTYKTDISCDEGDTLTNSVSLNSSIADGTETDFDYTVAKIDAGGTFKKGGWIEIVKEDGAGEPIAGAEFTLYSFDGKKAIKQSISSDKEPNKGIARIRAIPVGEYILEETEAPDGYKTIEDQYKVVVSGTGFDIKTNITKLDGKKSDNVTGTPESQNKLTVINFKEGIVGDLQITKLVAGNAGDKTKEFNFTVTFSDTGTKEFNYSKTFEKVKLEEGKIASGGTFTLSDGQTMIIRNIPKNTSYTVEEADYSSEGYRTETNHDKGLIVADDVILVDFTNTKNKSGGKDPVPAKGSVTVVKVDADTNKTLSGAVFQLLDRDKDIVSTSGKTGSDGEVIFDDLQLDVRYFIKEKTAPDGYEKSDELHTFILRNSNKEQNITIEVENKKIKEENPKTPEEEKPNKPTDPPIVIDPNKPPTTDLEIDTPKGPDKKDPESLYDIDPNGTPTTGIFDNDVPKGSKELDDTPKTSENTLGKNGAMVLSLISGCGLALLALLKRKKTKI